MQARSVLALDVGDVRVGVAVADAELKFAKPLTTLHNDDSIWQELQTIIDEQGVGMVVVGLPRGLNGQETEQTRHVEVFMDRVRVNVGLPVHPQDEAATSLKAEAELRARGKPYNKGDVDALAATYILEDYLMEPGRGSHGL